MFEMFFPKLFVDKIQEIDFDILKKKGIKGLILDIDNTLVPQHMAEADEDAVRWIEKVKGTGFKVCIVSNATKKRVIKFNEKLKLFAIHRALKPGTKAFKKAARLMDLPAENIAVVGDQIFTDIYGGNLAKMYTVLVKPIHVSSESIFVQLKRFPEKIVLKHYKRNSRRG